MLHSALASCFFCCYATRSMTGPRWRPHFLHPAANAASTLYYVYGPHTIRGPFPVTGLKEIPASLKWLGWEEEEFPFWRYCVASRSLKKWSRVTWGNLVLIMSNTGSRWAQITGGSCLLQGEIEQKECGDSDAVYKTPVVACWWQKCMACTSSVYLQT